MAFDVEQVKADLIAWLKDWFEENGKGCNAVIGISGGKDSSVTAALCVAALGRDRVIGVLMPNGVQSDINDAKWLVSHLGIRHYIINIKDAFDAIVNGIFFAGMQFSHQARVNLPPRLGRNREEKRWAGWKAPEDRVATRFHYRRKALEYAKEANDVDYIERISEQLEMIKTVL